MPSLLSGGKFCLGESCRDHRNGHWAFCRLSQACISVLGLVDVPLNLRCHSGAGPSAAKQTVLKSALSVRRVPNNLGTKSSPPLIVKEQQATVPRLLNVGLMAASIAPNFNKSPCGMFSLHVKKIWPTTGQVPLSHMNFRFILLAPCVCSCRLWKRLFRCRCLSHVRSMSHARSFTSRPKMW